ncbi:bacterio-opsin activator [Halobacteriales archaeon QS_4_62_28]|nr:MAG: bacterio-opsin activator [Halobacteriales archaeon QS_4_62_28]
MDEERSTVELKFEVRDTKDFFVAASETLDCRVVVEDTIYRTDGKVLKYFTVTARATSALQFARDCNTVQSARVVRDGGGTCLLETVVDRQGYMTGTLAMARAVTKRVFADDGVGTVIVEVPEHADPGAVIDVMLEYHEGTTLLSKWHREDSDLVAVTGAVGTERYLSALTTKQRDAVRAAVQGGYLAWPRQSSASECADALGVSQPTFSQHLYRGLEVLLIGLFDMSEEEYDGVSMAP